jgi:hypothetical protein
MPPSVRVELFPPNPDRMYEYDVPLRDVIVGVGRFVIFRTNDAVPA